MQQADDNHGTPPVAALSPREREVAALVAEGLSNAEIARRLMITPGTAANHVAHIIRALRARSRVPPPRSHAQLE